MTMEGIGLFSGIKSKMDYLNVQQRLISQNIANADTPSYQPKELKDVDFSRMVEKSMDERGPTRKITPRTTQAGHMTMSSGLNGQVRADETKETYEISPTGNAVVLEEQMVKANRAMMDYGLMSRIMTKNVNMIKRAVQGGGQ